MKKLGILVILATSIFSTTVSYGKVKLLAQEKMKSLPISATSNASHQWVLSLDKGEAGSVSINVQPGVGETYYDIGTFISWWQASGTYVEYVSDNCPQTLVYPSTCSIQYTFIPHKSVRLITGFGSIVSYRVNDPLGTTTGDSVTIYLNETPPSTYNPANPPPVHQQKKECGSIINVDGGILIESIPIVGTDFYLTYSNAYSSKYDSMYALGGYKDNFNPQGMSVSVLHYYDKAYKQIFLGNGEVRTADYISVNGYYYVLDEQGTEVYVFDPYSGQHLKTLYALTGADKFIFTYQGGKLTSITDAFGNVTTFNRDSSGLLQSIQAPFGQTTTISGSSQGINSVTNPKGEVFNITYSSSGLINSFQKPGGSTTTFTFDSDGRLFDENHSGGFYWVFNKILHVDYREVNQVSPLGKTSHFEYWANGKDNYRWEISASGLKSEHGQYADGSYYDWTKDEEVYYAQTNDERFGAALKRQAYFGTGKSGIYNYTDITQTVAGLDPYNPFSFTSITESVATNGRQATSVYTSANKTSVNTSHEGATVTIEIDNQERPTSFKVGNDTPWTFLYNMNGNIYQSSQGLKNTTTWAYNTNGNISSITNSLGQTTSFLYDLTGRVIRKTFPNGKYVLYEYDADGNLIGLTPPSLPEHIFQFNSMELVSEYQPPMLVGLSAKDTIYSYNADKQLSNVLRPDGQNVSLTYGTSTNVLSQVQLARGNTTYQYKTDSDLLASSSSLDGITTTFQYYGRTLKSEHQTRTSDGYLFAKYTYDFDPDHRLISRTLTGHSSSSSSTVGFTYNNDDNPTQIGDLSLVYSFPSGRLQSTNLDNISDERVYDQYGSLSSYVAKYNPLVGPAQILYSYSIQRDNAGRISERTETVLGVTNVFLYEYNTLGQLTSVTRNGSAYSSYVYDDNGNRISGSHAGNAFTATYDSQDRILSYNNKIYSYNANGDNIHVQWNTTDQSAFVYDALGLLVESTDTSGHVSTYKYDGSSRVVQKNIDGITITRRIYENDYRIAAEYSDIGDNLKEFIYATNINAPDYMKFDGSKFRFIKDHLGSTRLVVRADDGSVVQRIDYTDLGKVTNNSNPMFQPYVFAGGVGDISTNLVKFGARNYDPETGRWTTKDPILFGGGDSNLYAYVGNDPVNNFDPSGLKLKFVDNTAGKDLAKYIALIKSTKKGGDLLRKLEKRKQTYTVVLNECGKKPGEFDPETNTITIRAAGDLIAAVDKAGQRGLYEISAGRVLSHELGHALLNGGSEDAAIKIENGVYTPIDGYRRVLEGR